MFAKVFLSALVAGAAFVRADPNPTEPGPGDVFNEGSNCRIVWEPDTTGVWKVMNIELMSGSNFQMNHITTVATVDGTDAAQTVYEYPCPEVTPNSAIYFYQFTSPASSAIYWTTRFTIADASGKTTTPANPTQPDGQAIPWGVGALTDPSQAKPAPVKGTGNSTVASSTPVSSVVTVSPISSSVTTASVVVSVTPSSSASASGLSRSSSPAASSSASSAAASTTGTSANGAISMGSSLFHVAATLGLTFLGFAVAL